MPLSIEGVEVVYDRYKSTFCNVSKPACITSTQHHIPWATELVLDSMQTAAVAAADDDADADAAAGDGDGDVDFGVDDAVGELWAELVDEVQGMETIVRSFDQYQLNHCHRCFHC